MAIAVLTFVSGAAASRALPLPHTEDFTGPLLMPRRSGIG